MSAEKILKIVDELNSKLAEYDLADDFNFALWSTGGVNIINLFSCKNGSELAIWNSEDCLGLSNIDDLIVFISKQIQSIGHDLMNLYELLNVNKNTKTNKEEEMFNEENLKGGSMLRQCPNCGGTGYIEKLIPNGYGKTDKSEVCSVCGGDKFITVPSFVYVAKFGNPERYIAFNIDRSSKVPQEVHLDTVRGYVKGMYGDVNIEIKQCDYIKEFYHMETEDGEVIGL